jgi:hypothetical protein
MMDPLFERVNDVYVTAALPSIGGLRGRGDILFLLPFLFGKGGGKIAAGSFTH